MKKQLVTSKQLAAYITKELKKIEDCEDCIIRNVQQLRKMDNEGCNWSSDPIYISTGGVPSTYYRPHLNKIIIDAKGKFNLTDNDEM